MRSQTAAFFPSTDPDSLALGSALWTSEDVTGEEREGQAGRSSRHISHRAAHPIVRAATGLALLSVATLPASTTDEVLSQRRALPIIMSEFGIELADPALSMRFLIDQDDDSESYWDLDCAAAESPSPTEVIFTLTVDDLPRLQPSLGLDVLELPEDVDT